MSDEGRAHVLENSPFSGATFFVHYFLGDKANDDNGYKLWLSMTKLASKLRMNEKTVRRAIATLIENEHLELVEERSGRPHVYRFRFDGLGESSYTPHNPGSIPPGSLLRRLPSDDF